MSSFSFPLVMKVKQVQSGGLSSCLLYFLTFYSFPTSLSISWLRGLRPFTLTNQISPQPLWVYHLIVQSPIDVPHSSPCFFCFFVFLELAVKLVLPVNSPEMPTSCPSRTSVRLVFHSFFTTNVYIPSEVCMDSLCVKLEHINGSISPSK